MLDTDVFRLIACATLEMARNQLRARGVEKSTDSMTLRSSKGKTAACTVGGARIVLRHIVACLAYHMCYSNEDPCRSRILLS